MIFLVLVLLSSFMDISSLWMFPFIMSSSVKDAEKYKLGKPDNFHYLNQSKSYELEGVSNGEEYMKTRRAMGIVGISHDDQVQKVLLYMLLFSLRCYSDIL